MKRHLLYLILLYSSLLISQSPFAGLSYRFIGPDGNRAIAVAGEPGNINVMYVGAASGGLWKTEDAGINWKPITDSLDVNSIGSVALAPSDPKQVWIGTGETFVIRPAHSIGNGIYKSNDAGKTWKRMGLETSGRIGRVIIHPTNPDIVYACVMGHIYGPQKERGLWKTEDGGKNWKQILYVDDSTGCIDLSLNTIEPNILYAAMWTVNINTWGLNSGGTGGGIYRSKDGGKTWEPMNKKGLPGGKDRPVGKCAIAVAPSYPRVVYALFEIESPALYRSLDGGDTWTLMSRDHSMAERAPYYVRLAVATDNPDEIYYACVRFGHSKDGGKTWDPLPGWAAGGDNHDIWIDPKMPDRYMVGHDGCASHTTNRGKTFLGIELPIAQMYHIAVDEQIPYNVYGNRQDGWSYKGPGFSPTGRITIGMWKTIGGCESGFAKPDPFDPNIIMSGCYDGGLEVYDARTQHSRDIRVWPEAGYGAKPADMKYRWHWNFPLSWSTHTPHRVYVGSQYVHVSDDLGQTWRIISPDLTTNDKSHQQSSGGIAIDNLMTFDGSVLFAVEESPIQKDLIWTGSNDGQIHLTRDGGKNWENLTPNLNAPRWGTISNIEPSRYAAGTAYISYDMHQMGDFDPYIYKTADFGRTWKKISGGIPKSILSFVHCVREDHIQSGLLYAGTDNHLYVSPDDGASWHSLRLNLPPAPIYWIAQQRHFDDLAVATYGRGYYILDDMAAVRQWAQRLRTITSNSSLLPVRDGYRWVNAKGGAADPRNIQDGQNVPYGVPITLYLKDTLKSTAKIEIYEGEKKIKTLSVPNKPGMNRIWWNLRYEDPEKAKLRTLPPGKDWVSFGKDSTRILYTWDLDLMGGQLGPRVAPGIYTARITIEGKTETQNIRIRKDPTSSSTDAQITEQLQMTLGLRDKMNEAISMINELELLRSQMIHMANEIADTSLRHQVLRTEKSLQAISAQLYDIHLTGAREDAFRNPMQTYEKLAALASDLSANGADFPPTSQQREVDKLLTEKLQATAREYDGVPALIQSLNAMLQLKNKNWLVKMTKIEKP